MVTVALRIALSRACTEHKVSRVPCLEEIIVREGIVYEILSVCHHLDPVAGEVAATLVIQRKA